MKSEEFFVILALFPAITYQKSDFASLTYVGAVVGYRPIYQDKDNNKNLANYLKFIKKAAEFETDILVFPESSLSIPWSGIKSEDNRLEGASYIPHPDEKVAPCDCKKYALTIRAISCAARKHKMYVVIDHQEKFDCDWEECPSDYFLIYNTQVVYDRNGVVISRYRKHNLFFEAGTNTTEKVELSTFQTDFGVKFGQFISFDILFEKPALDLVRRLGVNDIVYSVNWVPTLPFGFNFEAQAGWAYENDVNFLSAGLNNPAQVSGGTGIYIGKKGYMRVSVDDKANTLMVAKIPKFIEILNRRAVNIDLSSLKVYNFSETEMPVQQMERSKKFPISSDIRQYVTELINHETRFYEKTLIHDQVNCNFRLNVTYDENVIRPDSVYYRYRLVAFKGVMSIAGALNAGVQICGLISCINDTIDGCGQLHDPTKTISNPITFNYFGINMQSVTIYRYDLLLPITLTQSMIPLNRTDYKYDILPKEYNFQLYTAKNDLMTFAIFGRNFQYDGKELTPRQSYPSSASTVQSKLWLLLTSTTLMKSLMPNW